MNVFKNCTKYFANNKKEFLQKRLIEQVEFHLKIMHVNCVKTRPRSTIIRFVIIIYATDV